MNEPKQMLLLHNVTKSCRSVYSRNEQFAMTVSGSTDDSLSLQFKSDKLLYRMGHEKVARLPFYTCPCDILSGVSMYIV